MVVCRGRLEGLVVEGSGFEGEEARDFEQIELVVGGLRYGMSGQVCIHECKRLLLALILDCFWHSGAVSPAFIVARVEFLVVELALVPAMASVSRSPRRSAATHAGASSSSPNRSSASSSSPSSSTVSRGVPSPFSAGDARPATSSSETAGSRTGSDMAAAGVAPGFARVNEKESQQAQAYTATEMGTAAGPNTMAAVK